MTTNLFQGPFLAIPLWATERIRQSGHARDLQLLVSLVALMERRTKEVRASVAQISEYSELSKETVKRSLKWLAEQGIVTVVRYRKPLTNSYRINYNAPDGVTADPIDSPNRGVDRVTADPINGSRLTPSKTESPLLTAQISDPLIEILDIDTENIKRTASGLEDFMILGADPDKPEKSFDPKPPEKKTRRDVTNLVSQFLSDPRSIMGTTYAYRDIIILRKTLNTLRDSGLTEFTVSQMIKRFMDVEHWRTAENPIMVFTNKGVQQKLMEQVDTEVSVEDPALMFIMGDFERNGIDMPWPELNDSTIRHAVIMHGMDICFRYPEVVADLITSHKGVVSPEFRSTLSALNSFIRVLAGEEDGDLLELQAAVGSVQLPPELHKPSKTNLRPAAGSILEAVYNYRRASHGKR